MSKGWEPLRSRTPSRPPIEAAWPEVGTVGNGWLAEQLGGPMPRDSRAALDDAGRGIAAGMLPTTATRSSLRAQIDPKGDRAWLTETRGFAGGIYRPGDFGPGALGAVSDMIGGGAGSVGVDTEQTVSIGVPLVAATRWLTFMGPNPSPHTVSQAVGIDGDTWEDVHAMQGGRLDRAADLPPGTVVRFGSSAALRADMSASASLDLGANRGPLDVDGSEWKAPDAPKMAAASASSDDVPKLGAVAGLLRAGANLFPDIGASVSVQLQVGRAGSSSFQVQRVGDRWIGEVHTERLQHHDAGGGADSGVPGANVAVGRTYDWLDVTRGVVVAHADDPTEMALFQAVMQAALRRRPDPIGQVEGVERIVEQRARIDDDTRTDHVGIASNTIAFEDEHHQQTGREQSGSDVHHWGMADAEYRNSLGVSNALTSTTRTDGRYEIPGTEGHMVWDERADQVSVRVSGGMHGEKRRALHADETVALDGADLRVLVSMAQSPARWASLYRDVSMKDAWERLGVQLRAPHIDAAQRAEDPQGAPDIARARAAQKAIESDSRMMVEVRNVLGRGLTHVTDQALGVLEAWPESWDLERAEYRELGAWARSLSQGMWAEGDRIDTLIDLNARADHLYARIETMPGTSDRARLEMLGQIAAWQDSFDLAWESACGPYATCHDPAGHRPTSVVRLEGLAAQCNSAADPHFRVLEGYKPGARFTPVLEISLHQLAGILGYWRRIARDLRAAYDSAGLPEALRRVGTGSEPSRSDLDPDLQRWERLVVRRSGLDTGETASEAALV